MLCSPHPHTVHQGEAWKDTAGCRVQGTLNKSCLGAILTLGLGIWSSQARQRVREVIHGSMFRGPMSSRMLF